MLAIGFCLVPFAGIAADIKGNDGWLPLDEARARYHLSPEFIDAVLDGGVEIACRRTLSNGGSNHFALNGWFLGPDTTGVHSVAHFLFRKNADGSRTRMYESLAPCYATGLREVMERTDFARLPLEPDLGQSLRGDGGDLYGDRSWIALPVAPPNARSIQVDLSLLRQLRVPFDIFLVSSSRPWQADLDVGAVAPMIQMCKVTRIFPEEAVNPAVLIAACDVRPGNSGGLAFTRWRGEIKPIGTLIAASETEDETGLPIDGLPYDERANSAVLLGLTTKYFDFIDDARGSVRAPGF